MGCPRTRPIRRPRSRLPPHSAGGPAESVLAHLAIARRAGSAPPCSRPFVRLPRHRSSATPFVVLLLNRRPFVRHRCHWPRRRVRRVLPFASLVLRHHPAPPSVWPLSRSATELRRDHRRSSPFLVHRRRRDPSISLQGSSPSQALPSVIARSRRGRRPNDVSAAPSGTLGTTVEAAGSEMEGDTFIKVPYRFFHSAGTSTPQGKERLDFVPSEKPTAERTCQRAKSAIKQGREGRRSLTRNIKLCSIRLLEYGPLRACLYLSNATNPN